jgi:diguanylate cyclase (GGDEF)-like protein
MPLRTPRAPHRALDSLAGKVALFVLLTVAVRAAVVGGITLDSSRGLFQRTLEKSFPAHADRCAARVSAWLALARGDVERAAGEAALEGAAPSLLAASPARREDAAAAARALEQALGRAAVLDGLWLADAEGRVRAQAGTPPPFAVVPREQLAPGAHAAAGPTGPVPIALAPFPEAGGWLGGHAAPAAVASLLTGDSLPGVGGAYLTDGTGAVLFRGRTASGPGEEPLPIADLLAQGARPTAAWRGSDGALRVAAVRPVARGGWQVAVVADLDAGFAPIGALLWRILLLDTALVLGVAALAFRLTSRIVRPIQALWDGARRISQGDLGVEIPETGGAHEIAELTRTFNAMARKLHDDQREIEAAQRQLRDQNQALQAANEVLAQLSITDGLTRLHNHRFFQEHLTRELKRVQRTREPLAMLLLDIDDFKSLNDRWGHAAGDAVLARIATVLNASVRESDLLARYGGEEFVVLAATDLEGAVVVAEKLRMAVERAPLAVDEVDGPLQVSVSIGVARYKGDRKRFFRDADRALYAAKAAGKNCVMVDEDSA